MNINTYINKGLINTYFLIVYDFDSFQIFSQFECKDNTQ
jgi:hypothetical protein